MFTHTLSKLLADKGLTSETKLFYVENEITGSDEEDDWFAENGVPDDDCTLQYHDDGLDGAIPAFNFLDLLNRENAVKLWGSSGVLIWVCTDSCDFTCQDCGKEWKNIKSREKKPDEIDNNTHKNCPRGKQYVKKLHYLLDIYLSQGEQAIEARLAEMLSTKT